jgi:predicted nucleic acid-binding protein
VRPSLATPAVVDASALVELLLRGERAAAVAQAVRGSQMTAPDVVSPEVLSVLRRMERTGEVRPERAGQAVADLLDAPVRRFATLPLFPVVWELRGSVSAYDACYVALARALGCPLVTGDLRLTRAPGLGVPLLAV